MSTADPHPPLPSNARFGWLFATVLAAVATYKLWTGKHLVASILAAVAMALVVAALTRPTVLQPLNRLWFEFGLLLGRIVSPLVLAILFFLIITPVALVGKLLRRDALRLRRRMTASHWIRREPPGPAVDSFKHQF
jgi:hypothetical protein